MKDKVPFYELVNMFFVGSVFTILALFLCFDSLPLDFVKDNSPVLADWRFLISAVAFIAMYEVGFIINKIGSIIVAPLLSKTKIWPREEYHVDVSEIAMKNARFQSMITELTLLRSHIVMFFVLTVISLCKGKVVYTVPFVICIAIFILAGRKHNARINIIRKDYQAQSNNPQCND